MPSMVEISAVRKAQASTTVRRRETGRSAGSACSSGSKQTTSQRPLASRTGQRGLPSTREGLSAVCASGTCIMDGKRFSKMATL